MTMLSAKMSGDQEGRKAAALGRRTVPRKCTVELLATNRHITSDPVLAGRVQITYHNASSRQLETWHTCNIVKTNTGMPVKCVSSVDQTMGQDDEDTKLLRVSVMAVGAERISLFVSLV
jgi:hypothetical protein